MNEHSKDVTFIMLHGTLSYFICDMYSKCTLIPKIVDTIIIFIKQSKYLQYSDLII
jgi:hypothetical protein